MIVFTGVSLVLLSLAFVRVCIKRKNRKLWIATAATFVLGVALVESQAGSEQIVRAEANPIASAAPTLDPTRYLVTDTVRAWGDESLCQDSQNAMDDPEAAHRIREAVSNGNYHDFARGDIVHVTDLLDGSIWVMVSDDKDYTGCVSTLAIPGPSFKAL